MRNGGSYENRVDSTRLWPYVYRFMLLLFLFLGCLKSNAQQATTRVYADNQVNNDCLLCATIAVTDEEAAVDKDVETYSTLSITLLGSVYQQLEFTGPNQPSASDAVHIKVGTQSALLGLLTGVEIQAYNNNSAVGSSIQLNALISLLNGADQQEIVFSPGVFFDAVRLTNTAVSLAGGLDIYEAYFYKSVPGPVSCITPVDILYGSTGSIAGGLNAIEDPYNSIDGNLLTAATIRANVSALNKTHLTALFPGVAPGGDYIKIIIQNPGGLLVANLLSTNFTIRTFLNNTDNGALALDTSLLKLSLFPGSTTKQVLIYPVPEPFNRIEVSLGEGLVTALDDLLVFEISRLAAEPDISGLIEGKIEVCIGESINLSIENPITGTTYNWYTQSNGGVPVATTPVYNPGLLAVGDHIYYVSALRTSCTEESMRAPITIQVFPRVGNPDITVTNTLD